MVMSYLVHHGYCSTAEAFAKTCGQAVAEDLVSMQNRQSKKSNLIRGRVLKKTVLNLNYFIGSEIQQLVLEGRIKEAEEETKNLYTNLLESNPDLLFMLRCRHFVELVGQSMNRKDKRMEEEDLPSISNGNNFCNGDSKESPDQEDLKACEEMDVAYSNGYQNGCGGADEMGKILGFFT